MRPILKTLNLSPRYKLLFGFSIFKPWGWIQERYPSEFTFLSFEVKSEHIPDVCPNGNSLTKFSVYATIIAFWIHIELNRLRFVIPVESIATT